MILMRIMSTFQHDFNIKVYRGLFGPILFEAMLLSNS